MSIKNVLSGFKVCGIFPFNREAISQVPIYKQHVQMESLASKSGLAYIPLFSPAKSPGKSHTRTHRHSSCQCQFCKSSRPRRRSTSCKPPLSHQHSYPHFTHCSSSEQLAGEYQQSSSQSSSHSHHRSHSPSHQDCLSHRHRSTSR